MNKIKNTEIEYFLLKTKEIKEELENSFKELKEIKHYLPNDASWDWNAIDISLAKANNLALHLQKSAEKSKKSLLGPVLIKTMHKDLINLISYKEYIKKAIISLKTLEEENFN